MRTEPPQSSSMGRQIKKKNENAAWSKQRDSIRSPAGAQVEMQHQQGYALPQLHTLPRASSSHSHSLEGSQRETGKWLSAWNEEGDPHSPETGHYCAVNVPGFEWNVLLTSEAHSKCFIPCDMAKAMWHQIGGLQKVCLPLAEGHATWLPKAPPALGFSSLLPKEP